MSQDYQNPLSVPNDTNSSARKVSPYFTRRTPVVEPDVR